MPDASKGGAAVEDIRAENERLKSENRELRDRLKFFESHSTIARGIKGETLVMTLVSGARSAYGDGHDVLLSNDQLMEVKFSTRGNHSQSENSKRWSWVHVFGASGKKKYDYLLLVGEADGRFRDRYKDPSSPYVIFCLTYAEAYALSGGTHLWQLQCNPQSSRSRFSKLYTHFQITSDELTQRFEFKV